jgi:hypothetical protein
MGRRCGRAISGAPLVAAQTRASPSSSRTAADVPAVSSRVRSAMRCMTALRSRATAASPCCMAITARRTETSSVGPRWHCRFQRASPGQDLAHRPLRAGFEPERASALIALASKTIHNPLHRHGTLEGLATPSPSTKSASTRSGLMSAPRAPAMSKTLSAAGGTSLLLGPQSGTLDLSQLAGLPSSSPGARPAPAGRAR